METKLKMHGKAYIRDCHYKETVELPPHVASDPREHQQRTPLKDKDGQHIYRLEWYDLGFQG
mgnify:CR=1 FL=1